MQRVPVDQVLYHYFLCIVTVFYFQFLHYSFVSTHILLFIRPHILRRHFFVFLSVETEQVLVCIVIYLQSEATSSIRNILLSPNHSVVPVLFHLFPFLPFVCMRTFRIRFGMYFPCILCLLYLHRFHYFRYLPRIFLRLFCWSWFLFYINF